MGTPEPTGCAVDTENGGLKSPSQILFYESESDKHPIPSAATAVNTGPDKHEAAARRSRNKSNMAEIIDAEQRNSDGELETLKAPKRAVSGRSKKPRRKKAKVASVGDNIDSDDNFSTGSSDETSDSEVDEDTQPSVPNDELADILPAKTVPSGGRNSGRTRRKATVEEVEDEDSRRPVRDQPMHGHILEEVEGMAEATSQDGNKCSRETVKKNPIYYFYQRVANSANGTTGQPSDRHYKCLHGNKKIFTLKKSMKYNLTTMINNLKTSAPQMYRLYSLLKERPPSQPPTEEELDVAAGRKVLGTTQAKEWFNNLEKASANIREAFQQQSEASAEPWDQDEFEQLIAEWIVACDQPFDEVDKPEFRKMLTYAHHPAPNLKIPHRDAIKRRIMKIGEDTVEGTKKMFTEDIDSKISLSIDAWTSSNNYAFLAIVAHYITKEGDPEELLIDFRELLGEHSGENMAEAVWATVKQYGIEKKIFAFMLDNASNNDTMLKGIQSRAEKEGITFNAEWARLRCMPHTIHLSALKLLEAIGAISKEDGKKAASRRGNYQDSVTALLDRTNDDDAAVQQGGDEQDDIGHSSDKSGNILPAVDKLRKIIRAVRSSPQRKQSWLKQLEDTFRGHNGADRQEALMLILDVRTRWSSTHQMMRRALQFRKEIDDFTGRHRDLRDFEMDSEDWDAIAQVASWLKAFRSATTDMSRTKEPMISTIHAIFRGLQDHVKGILKDLPDDAPDQLRDGLLEAHRKLSDYYYRSDESPFYTWAAILDPRIMYEGLKDDYASEAELLAHLESSKTTLESFYQQHYAGKARPQPLSRTPTPTASFTTLGSPEKVNFTSRYQKKDRIVVNELEEFLKLPREDFDTCKPLKWWAGRRSQFPNLYKLACDLFAIPGSAVAVERVFSGGRDTISLRRASLVPDTIRILMLVKQCLRLARHDLKKRDSYSF